MWSEKENKENKENLGVEEDLTIQQRDKWKNKDFL